MHEVGIVCWVGCVKKSDVMSRGIASGGSDPAIRIGQDNEWTRFGRDDALLVCTFDKVDHWSRNAR